jgi:flagellin-specific chaperone FliS
MLTTEVAMLNGLISETDSIIKAILLILSSKYKNNQEIEGEEKMTPSNPDNHFDIIQAILNLMEKKVWNSKSVYRRVRIYIALFNYLCSQSQDMLPYHIPRVDSNDTIFLGDDTFQTGLVQLLNTVFEKIINIMTELNNCEDRESQAMLSMSMTSTAACLTQNMNKSENMSKFIQKLVKKGEKSYVKCKRFITNGYLEKTKKYIQRKYEN